MSRLVMKFGGTSVGDPEMVRNAAAHVKREVGAGHEVGVVVSAMAGETDRLIDLTRRVARRPDPGERDVVVSAGEQIGAGLLAMALRDVGVAARSWTGWQAGVRTTDVHGAALIERIDAERLVRDARRGCVPIITGFQGVASDGRVTTLGRGGSDASAVAVAAAIRADRCDVYTDVDGIYTADPRVVPRARKLDGLSYEETLELASSGAKVMQARAVDMAMRLNVPIRVRSSFDSPDADDDPRVGTLVSVTPFMERRDVSGAALVHGEAKISLFGARLAPSTPADVFGPLAAAHVNVDMIIQNASRDGRSADVAFSVSQDDLERTMDEIARMRPIVAYDDVRAQPRLAKVSVVGTGMRRRPGVAWKTFRALADARIVVHAVSTSEIKISVLVDDDLAETALRAIHDAHGLDRATDDDA